MNKTVFAAGIMCVSGSSALAAEELGIIEVESTRLSDVSGEEVKSADLADALSNTIPSISIVRRSGIANDIILRGQKKDNINVLIDDTKIYGACPNRMDPPISHVLTNTIDSIDIIEGPYDVENFGTLSGAVKITTRKPAKGLSGEVSVNAGSYDYRKAAATVSGGAGSAIASYAGKRRRPACARYAQQHDAVAGTAASSAQAGTFRSGSLSSGRDPCSLKAGGAAAMCLM